jgi:hypothetical protein
VHPLIRSCCPRRVVVLLLLGVLAGALGCERTVPVKGTVTIDNRPLENGSVLFIPDKEKDNTTTSEPRGVVKDGKYELFTTGKPGAPVGWYKVVVSAGVAVEADNTKVQTPSARLASKYNDPERTDLRVEVKPDGSFDLKLIGGATGGVPPMPGTGGIPPMPGTTGIPPMPR